MREWGCKRENKIHAHEHAQTHLAFSAGAPRIDAAKDALVEVREDQRLLLALAWLRAKGRGLTVSGLGFRLQALCFGLWALGFRI